MKKTFAYCQSLEDIQFYNMTLSNVKDMSHMFEGTSIVTFAPNRFDIRSVESMASMFKNCYKLSTVKFVEASQSPNLNDMSNMFSGCESLVEINLNDLQTNKVKSMSGLFQGCPERDG